MGSHEFLRDVVLPNYWEFDKCPDVRLLWNALVSMNSVAEHLALDELKYADVSRNKMDKIANKKRDQYELLDAEPVNATATTTGVTSDKETWKIIDHSGKEFDLVDVLRKALAKLNEIPELKE
jgi:hypothetical protein